MKKYLLLLIVCSCAFINLNAQQDPMFTKYMFNTLAYNPAYAGSKEFLSIRALYRNQWWGIEGAPTSQTITAHSPIMNRVGVGINLNHDQIGINRTTTGYLNYAYRIPFGKGTVSLGVQGGVVNYRKDYDLLKYKDPRGMDESFLGDGINKWMPNFGAGVYYYSETFYAGISSPHLINYDLRDDASTTKWAKTYRHYYFTAGAAIPLTGNSLIFKPSGLLKVAGAFGDNAGEPNSPSQIGAPIELDVDASFLFYQTFWLGASFRTAIEASQFGGESSFDSADIWAAVYLQNGLLIGASYDYTLTKLQEYAKGSFEVMLGYDFNYKTKKVNTPRYF